MNDPVMISAREAATLLGVSLGVARDMMKNGRFGPRVRIGQTDYAELENVLAYRPREKGQHRRLAEVAEDAEWLLACGEEADTIRRRCGYRTWNAFSSCLRRAGHQDLLDRIVEWTAQCGHTTGGHDLLEDRRLYASR